MSRYVHVRSPVTTLAAVAQALTAMGVAFEQRAQGIMLRGSLECSGEPVPLRVAAGVAESVEDFGFALQDGAVVLVCGDVDREVLCGTLLAEVTRRCLQTVVADLPGVAVVGVRRGSGRGSDSGGSASGG